MVYRRVLEVGLMIFLELKDVSVPLLSFIIIFMWKGEYMPIPHWRVISRPFSLDTRLAFATALLAILGPLQILAQATLISYPFTSLSINALFDNQAASADGSADFDGNGNGFDSQFLPTGPWTYDGITYDLPETWGTTNDNVIANGQVITLEEPTFVRELHIVYSGDAGGAGEKVTTFQLGFADNSTAEIQLYARNWWKWPYLNNAPIRSPYSFETNGTEKNLNHTKIFQWSNAINSEQKLQSITLPTKGSSQRLHIFAMAFTPASNLTSSGGKPQLTVRRTRFTSRWEDIGGVRAQAVQVTLSNMLPTYTLSKNTSLNSVHSIEITGEGIKTVTAGKVYRLVPGDDVRVDVFVTGSTNGTNATVTVKDSSGKVVGVSSGWPASSLVEKWTADADVLRAHETPTWWNNAKYGIFIHWGVYSVPAWGPPSSYAEWYNWNLHSNPGSSNPTWEHHLQTYGPDVLYDDFIANYTASKFNASQWVDLFDQAGAKYFVAVTKHHDGFALFDTGNTTNRNALLYGPKRDLLQELFDTAKNEKPNLHRGTYYSLPEWFNPDYAKYGFGQWPGGLAKNAFNTTPELEPYTGRVDIGDYVEDLQLPQMKTLAERYGTEIMWCDIGGPNKTLEFAADFYNNAMEDGRQVTMNDRCAAVPDFSTPEYATFGSTQADSWESSEGMDPFSYGLNTATNASEYKNATTIVQTLVDVVSKNGNFLLDIGPTAEGEIIQPERDNLLAAGVWLKYSGECIYNTTYWSQTPQDINPPSSAPAVRFTTTPSTFCIVAFDVPSDGRLVIGKRLPLLPGDEMVLLNPGSSLAGTEKVVQWEVNEGSGEVSIDVERREWEEGNYAWAFLVRYAIDK